MSENNDLLDPGVTGNSDLNNVSPSQIPNAGGILALGIISIATCWLYGVPGLICGLIAISMHKKAKGIYETNPQKYQQSYNTAKAGYICGIIGTCISGLYFLFFLLVIIGVVAGSSYSRF